METFPGTVRVASRPTKAKTEGPGWLGRDSGPGLKPVPRCGPGPSRGEAGLKAGTKPGAKAGDLGRGLGRGKSRSGRELGLGLKVTPGLGPGAQAGKQVAEARAGAKPRKARILGPGPRSRPQSGAKVEAGAKWGWW